MTNGTEDGATIRDERIASMKLAGWPAGVEPVAGCICKIDGNGYSSRHPSGGRFQWGVSVAGEVVDVFSDAVLRCILRLYLEMGLE